MQTHWVVLLSYVIGSLPCAWLICRLVAGKDLRLIGSGNTGASNLKRVPGCEKFYVPAVLLDALKGVGAFVLARYWGLSSEMQVICGLTAVVGHRYPVWLGFRGGKGVATTLGVISILHWPLAVAAFLVFVFLKKKTGFTSLASVVGVLVFAISFSFVGDDEVIRWIWAIFALIFTGHILNLNLIALGCENSSKRERPVMKFAFIVHPTDDRPDYLRNYLVTKVPRLAAVPCWVINFVLVPVLFLFCPFVFVKRAVFENRVEGREGARTSCEGLVLGVPMGPRLMLRNERLALWAIARMIRLGAMAGATHAGLGAYTAIVGDGGRVLRDRFRGRILVTTGNDYTAWTGVHSLELAAEKLGKRIEDCVLLVIGIGSVGSIAARLASELLPVKKIILCNRTRKAAEACAEAIKQDFQRWANPNLDVVVGQLDEVIGEADLIISATSATHELAVDEAKLKLLTAICDLARPRDFCLERREDVLLYAGGMVSCRGAQLPSMLGLPPEQSFACLYQTQALADAGETEFLGGVARQYYLFQVKAIAAICNARSDGIAELRSGEGDVITGEDIERIKKAAQEAVQ